MLLGLRLEVLGFWGFRFWIGRLGGEGWGFWKSLLVSAPYDLGSWVPLTRAQVFVAEFHSPSLGFVALHCSTP